MWMWVFSEVLDLWSTTVLGPSRPAGSREEVGGHFIIAILLDLTSHLLSLSLAPRSPARTLRGLTGWRRHMRDYVFQASFARADATGRYPWDRSMVRHGFIVWHSPVAGLGYVGRRISTSYETRRRGLLRYRQARRTTTRTLLAWSA